MPRVQQIEDGGVEVARHRLDIADTSDPAVRVRSGGGQRFGHADPTGHGRRSTENGTCPGGEGVQMQVVIAEPGQQGPAATIVYDLTEPPDQTRTDLDDVAVPDPNIGADAGVEFGVAQQQTGHDTWTSSSHGSELVMLPGVSVRGGRLVTMSGRSVRGGKLITVSAACPVVSRRRGAATGTGPAEVSTIHAPLYRRAAGA